MYWIVVSFKCNVNIIVTIQAKVDVHSNANVHVNAEDKGIIIICTICSSMAAIIYCKMGCILVCFLDRVGLLHCFLFIFWQCNY